MKILIFSLFFNSTSWGASLSITPMRLELSAQEKIAVLKLTNVSDEPIVLQMEVKEWQQNNEENVYTSTKDIIVAPPMTKIGPQERQIIRLSARNNNVSNQEAAYRLFLNEIAQSPTISKPGIQTILSMSLPLFIKPKEPVTLHPIWSVSRVGKHELKINLLNKSNVHLKVTKIKIQAKNESKPIVEKDVLDYILPSKNKGWTFALPASFKNNEIKVSADTDQGELSEILQLSSF